MKRFTLIILFLICSGKIYSQVFQISGQLSDKNSNTLPGAGIYLLNQNDSSVIKGVVTDPNGNFILSDLHPGKYLIKFSFIGFNDLFLHKEITNQSLNLGKLILSEKASTLGVVNIIDKVPPTELKGDTTQYNADAFKTNKDATAEDLVTKMPGITSQDGKVQAQGEDVKKVLIDGKPYLGDDPNAALKNLPAEVIDKIQVFDKKSDQSEFTGFDDGNTTKTINIVTRPRFRNGTFGRVFAGDGTDELWKSGLSLNFFKDKRKLTILGNANNINEQNFSTDDLLGVLSSSTQSRGGGGSYGSRPGGGGGSAGRYQPQNDASTFLTNQKDGITTTYSAGLNYINQWNKLDFSMSYFFNRTDNNATSNLFRQYFTTSSDGLTYKEDNLNTSENTNNRSNMRFEYKFDTLNSILFQPRVSFQDNTSFSTIAGKNADNTGSLSNAVSNYNSDMKGVSFSSPLLYRHSFSKKGRTFSANLVAGYNQNKGNSDLNSLTVYSVDTIPSDTMNQVSDINSNGWNYSSFLMYTEPVKSHGQVALTYKGGYNTSFSDKETFSYSPSDGLYNNLDTALSNKFTSNYLTQSVGSNYRFSDTKWNTLIGISLQQSQLKNDREFPNADNINKTFNSFLPNAMLQYKFSLRKNLRMYYRSSNNPPSISQLQNVINNNNPLLLTTGNPDLKQDMSNYLNIRYSSIKPENSTSFFIFISGTYTNNYIGNANYLVSADTTIGSGTTLAAGSQLSKPVNIDGYYSLRSFATYSFPIKVLKSILNLNGNASITRTPSLLNNVSNYSTTTGSGMGLALSSNISDKFDFLLSSNGTFNNIKNTIDENSNSRSFNLNSKFKIQLMPWKGLVLETDINHQYNYGLSSSYNQNYILWNAAIGYKFLKNQVADLRLSVFDIMKQNNSISRNTTDIYYEDVQTNVLQQYFMLTFTYNLKFFKVKKAE